MDDPEFISVPRAPAPPPPPPHGEMKASMRWRGGGRGSGRGRGRGRNYNQEQKNKNRNYHQSRPLPQQSNMHTMINPLSIEEKCTNSSSSNPIRIAVEGCCHGTLSTIYSQLQSYESQTEKKIDLLLCCGDFQSLRNTHDFSSISMPNKYKSMGDFHQYYSGEKKAPILTIFVGGNHENSIQLQELRYGGWVAPNIYYMGTAGCVNYGGLRIAGISGIYKEKDYSRGHFERPPYNDNELRSVYHVRNDDAYRMSCLTRGPIDIVLSHDWPRGIEQFGDVEDLIRKKKYFKKEVEENCLGSPVNEYLLDTLKPKRWFSAHLHVKFEAVKHHQINDELQQTNERTTIVTALESDSSTCQNMPDLTAQMTKFLSLDKCLPRRNYMQVITMPRSDNSNESINELCYDPEWLAILSQTHHLTRNTRDRVIVPKSPTAPSQDDIQRACKRFAETSFVIPHNHRMTVAPHGREHMDDILSGGGCGGRTMVGNPQTDEFLEKLGLEHVVTVPYIGKTLEEDVVVVGKDENEIDLCDDLIGNGSCDSTVSAFRMDGTYEIVMIDEKQSRILPTDVNEVDLDEEEEEDDVSVNDDNINVLFKDNVVSRTGYEGRPYTVDIDEHEINIDDPDDVITVNEEQTRIYQEKDDRVINDNTHGQFHDSKNYSNDVDEVNSANGKESQIMSLTNVNHIDMKGDDQEKKMMTNDCDKIPKGKDCDIHTEKKDEIPKIDENCVKITSTDVVARKRLRVESPCK